MLWHHIELREARLSTEAKEFRPRSFLISPTLSLARQGLLEQYKITWIQSTAEAFAADLLSKLTIAASEGLEALRREHNLSSDLASNVRSVSELVANPPSHRTEYLLGEHPHWSDLTKDRAVVRASDDEILEICRRSLKNRSPDDPAPIVVVSGTGGAGKSTSLMRVALRLSAEGHAVGWVGTDTEASPRTIGEVAESDSFSILAIDDLDRYGSTLPSMLRRVCSAKPVRLVVGALRASRVEVTMDDPVLRGHRVVEHPIPHLTDADIDRLLSVLDKEHRLGKLKGLSKDEQRSKFREHAGRQILVAMIEATSGKRFEEKVLLEWQDLPPRHRMVYAMIAVAGALGIPVSKSELLLGAGRSRGIDDVAALTALAERRIVTCDTDTNLYRPRHRVIAETLLDELRKTGQELTGVIEGLAFAVSSSVAPDMPQSARPRRLVRILLNNEYLFRNVGLESGRKVYEAVEENLHWDHHFWLQRGVLELHEGAVSFAEHCLDQAKSLPHNDPLVDTAYAHMLFRKAIANPGAADASRWVTDAVETLRTQIEVRGTKDPYPYDVVGRQAIQWSGRAPWPVAQRKALLEEIRRLVKKGVAALPRHHELAKLDHDILRAILSL
jgi:Mrp family chromosome partitioning ATPase